MALNAVVTKNATECHWILSDSIVAANGFIVVVNVDIRQNIFMKANALLTIPRSSLRPPSSTLDTGCSHTDSSENSMFLNVTPRFAEICDFLTPTQVADLSEKSSHAAVRRATYFGAQHRRNLPWEFVAIVMGVFIPKSSGHTFCL